MIEEHIIAPERITGGGHHFFGYYDKSPWNASGRYHLALEVPFIDRLPTRDDPAIIGTIDTLNGNAWTPVAETTAWSWQQGTNLQWLPSELEHTIVYNIREDDRFYAVIHDLATGETRRLSRSFYAIGTDYAIGLNYARLFQTRPCCGYPDGAENTLPDPHPDHDGIYRIDLATGGSELIVSLQRLFEVDTLPLMRTGPHWVNLLMISPGGSNFIFLNRCRPDPKMRFNDRFFCASADGGTLRLVHDESYFSHFAYYEEDVVGAYARIPGTSQNGYAFFNLKDDRVSVFGEGVLPGNGHCSFSPDRKWMLTDTYPDARNLRTLTLYELASGRRIDIGRFYSPPELAGEVRCDLHPRWSRDGRRVSIDSAHEGVRQVYALDVSEITA